MTTKKKTTPAPVKSLNAGTKIDTTNKAEEKVTTAKTVVAAANVTTTKDAADGEKSTAKEVPADKTATAEKSIVKKATAKKATAKKKELKSDVHIQFDGKSYSQEDLVKIAKDVWKYDLKQKVRELTSIELYVKPEESTVYYVMNKDFNGSFLI